MRQPTAKVIFFFLGVLGVGYAIGMPVMTGILQMPLNLVNFLNLSAFAFLFAVLMTIWLDRPLELDLFKWPEERPKAVQRRSEAAAPPVVASPPVQPPGPAPTPDYYPRVEPGKLFPHETPSDHWEVDFGDGHQVYQGSELPVWILAGWVVFIIWAIVYLVSGLPTAF
jgi:hypothetical protein